MKAGDWIAAVSAVISAAALAVAWWAVCVARMSATVAEQQAAIMWQQLGQPDAVAAPAFTVSKTRWRGRQVRLRVQQVSGPALAQVKTTTRAAGLPHTAVPGSAVWHDTATGAVNTLALWFTASPPRKSINVVLDFNCTERDGLRTWHRTFATVVKPPLFY